MKKILTFAFCLYISIISYSQVSASGVYNNRGLEMMRESNINAELGLQGKSGSSQIVEGFLTNSKEYKSKGILLGTVSNFTNLPNLRAGLTLAYQKYKAKEEDYKTRDYSLDTYFSYKYNKNIFMGSLAYSQQKNVEKKEYSVAVEYGRLLKNNFYAYLNTKRIKQDYKTRDNFSFMLYSVGLTRFDYSNKFRISTGLEYNYINKKIEERDRGSLEFSVGLGYFIHDDLICDLKYRGIKNSKFYDSIVSLGFTHSF